MFSVSLMRPVARFGLRSFTSHKQSNQRHYAWGTEEEDRHSNIYTNPSFKLTYQDTIEARNRLRGKIGPAPCHLSARLSANLGTELYLKKEHTLLTGSYKGRGILNKLSQLTPEEMKQGVVCASSGNFAVALSHHAKEMGIECVIVLPTGSYFTQVTTSRANGAKVILHGPDFQECVKKAQQIAENEKRVFLHTHNDKDVCAGYATVAHELIRQNPYLDVVMAPVSGGLLPAMALVIKTVNPRIKVFGVESLELQDLTRTLAKPAHTPKNLVDAPGLTPYEICKEYVDDILLVTENQRASAILRLMELEKTVVQGSGVGAVAAVLSNVLPEMYKGSQVAAVCTGGNIESSLLVRVIDKGLVQDGRMARVRVTIKENQLTEVTCILSGMKANVRDVYQERAFLTDEVVGYVQPTFTLEVRDHDHLEDILEELHKAGFDKTTVSPVPSISTPHRSESH